MEIEIMPGVAVRRDVLEAIIERGIEALNRADGDSDAEAEHDEDAYMWLEKAR